MYTIVRFVIFCALVFFLLASHTAAQEKGQSAPEGQAEDPPQSIRDGYVLICDTADQIKRFVALFRGDVQSTLGKVNAEAGNPVACGVAYIVFRRLGDGERFEHNGMHYRVIEIEVLAAHDGQKMVVFPSPLRQFSVTRYDGRGA